MLKFKAKSLATKLIAVTGGTIALVLLASNTVLIDQTQSRVSDLVYAQADTEAKAIAARDPLALTGTSDLTVYEWNTR